MPVRLKRFVGNPILTDKGTSEENFICCPHVEKWGDTYYMFYDSGTTAPYPDY